MLRTLYLIYHGILTSTLLRAVIVIIALVLLFQINRKLSVLIEQGKEKPGQDTAPPKEEDSADRMEE